MVVKFGFVLFLQFFLIFYFFYPREYDHSAILEFFKSRITIYKSRIGTVYSFRETFDDLPSRMGTLIYGYLMILKNSHHLKNR